MANKKRKVQPARGRNAGNRPNRPGGSSGLPRTPARDADAESRTSITKSAETLQARRGMSAEELWADLRQGARNVSGVTWQVAVCVHLLVAARSGELPFVDLVPEGFEDADCLAGDGSRTFAQMKELDAGRGEMGPAAVADALAHAEAGARGSSLALITDGSLSSGLHFTGWSGTLDKQSGPGIQRVSDGLVKRGYGKVEVISILRRAHVVQLPFRIRQATESLLAESSGIHPAVAGIVVDRLTAAVARASADQRRGTAATASRIRVSDLDALIVEVQDTVDVTGLDVAVSGGVCSPVSFMQTENTSAATFYLGVDGHPGHVAANLDVVRPGELGACADGLQQEQSVLLVGPSGCGKSVLLWRAARELVPASRVLRVDRVQDASDATILARHVRLLRPTETSPVLVVADDLGRPRTAAWEHAASLLREIPAVLLLAASRAEDFSPSMVVGATRVVEPSLTAEVAGLLGDRIEAQGIRAHMTVAEAFQRSEGLLMEFLALLTTGHRLRQVLGAQVAGLGAPERATQREAARLVTAAHTLGLGLTADRLAEALSPRTSQSSHGDITALARVGDALGVLRDEHLAIQDGDMWKGLHELRSRTLSELLHENPPPRMGTTLARVAAIVDPVHAGWMVRRVAETHPECVSEVVGALAEHWDDSITATDLASLLEGGERADNALYVRAALPVLADHRPETVTLADFALITYPERNQAITLEEIGNEGYDRYVRRVKRVAAQLPLRADYDSTLRALCAGINDEWLEHLVLQAPAVDVVRVLEAGNDALGLTVGLVRSLFRRLAAPHDVFSALVWSRLVAACATHLTPDEVTQMWGPPLVRAELLCRADPHVLDVQVEGTTVSVRRLLPVDGAGELPPLLPWDLRRPGATNALNEATVACLERLKDACPELHRFQATTITASGLRYHVRDHEPGIKNMPRENFMPRETVRRAVGFQAALRRSTSSQTWTEVVQVHVEVAASLTTAAVELPLRLRPQDNARRRAQWRANLADVRTRLGELRPPPLLVGAGPDSAMAHSDNADRAEDKTTRVLEGALQALDAVANTWAETHNSRADKVPVRPLAIAMSLRDAADAIEELKTTTSAVIEGQGSVLPAALVDAMRAGANFAAAVQIEPATAQQVRADSPLASGLEVWEDVRDRRAAANVAKLQELLLRMPEVTFALIEDPDPASWTLETRSWVVFAPAEVYDDALLLLETLDDDAREALGPHTVLLSVIFGDQELGERWVGPPLCTSLGFGHQLASHATQSALPLPPDNVITWAREANLPRAQASAESGALLDRLTARSHSAAVRRMRQLPETGRSGAGQAGAGQAGSGQAGLATGATMVGEDDGAEGRGSRLAEDSLEALEFLERHVAAEESGQAQIYLADVLTMVTGNRPIDRQAAELLGAVAALHLTNLSLTGAESDR